jgi:hypothetical protein
MYLQHDAPGPTLECPNCGCIVDIEEALEKKFEQEFRSEMSAQREELEKKLRAREEMLKHRESEFNELKQRENDLFLERLEKEKQKLEASLQTKLEKDYKSLLSAKEQEIAQTTARMQGLQNAEIENAKLKRSLLSQQKDLELQFEHKLTEQLKHIETQVALRENSRIELLMKEKEKQLNDQKKMIDELQRRSGQGAVQLQGEVQEMAIAEWLAAQFPLDMIEEIKTGVRGADCLQSVHTREMENCGTIYYESKRTKDFQPTWIEKFKDDMREKAADIGVIVTQAMPKDMPAMGQINGIWICTFDEFKGLSLVLREMLVRVRTVTTAQVDKSDKMEMLYGFLTSQEFKMYVETVVEGFTQMHSDLQREKNAMHRLWNQREKQIRRVLESTSAMFGAIRGIAGNTFPDIDQLQLSMGLEDDDSASS